MSPTLALRAAFALARGFARDQRGASAVEFSIVAAPFIFLLLGLVQLGIYYMAQSALDAGVLRTAELLHTNFVTGSTPVLPAAAALKTDVISLGGGMLTTNGLSVEVRQLTSLTSGTVAIVDGTTDYGSTTSTLVVRAQSSIILLVPGLRSVATVTSSALVRRQGT